MNKEKIKAQISKANKKLVRRWQEAYNTGDLDALDDILAPNWATNAWPEGIPQTIEAAKELGRGMLALVPDYHCRIDKLVADGDQVVMRWTASGTHAVEIMGCAPTGRKLEWGGVSLFRIEGERIVSHWAYGEELTFLEDLGAELPPEWGLAKHHGRQRKALSDAERVELQRSVTAEHVQGESDSDWPAVYDTYIGEESFIDAVPLSVRFAGLAGIKEFYGTFDAAFPDMHFKVTGEYHVPGTSVLECTVFGTQLGELLGVPASGNPVRVELCGVFRFGEGDDVGKILFERVYLDMETLLRQCRGEAGPTGLGLADGEVSGTDPS